MKDGEIQQVDTPLNLYAFPVNKFVAGFIGSPSMNFLKVRVVEEPGGVYLLGEGVRIQTNPKMARELRQAGYLNREVWLGVRPEHLSLGDDPENRLVGEVEIVEPLGADTELHVNVGGTMVTAKLEGHVLAKPGERVVLTTKRDRLHVFDLESEKAISHAQEAEKAPA